MSKLYRLFLIFPLCFILNACTTTGNVALKNEDALSIQRKIIKGKTTKQDLNSMFGKPTSRSIDMQGDEMWVYTFTRTQISAKNFIPVYRSFVKGSSAKTRKVTVIFENGSNTVKTYSVDEYQDAIKVVK